MNRATSAHYVRIPSLQHRRQDVCSGLTNPIGGDIRDLPFKALRNVMTPLIESLDLEARNRLQARLYAERRAASEVKHILAKKRLECQEDLRNRKNFFAALERCSGIPPRPTSNSSVIVPRTSERTEQLALPRARQETTVSDCQEAFELINVSTPEVFDILHKRAS
jgi:hypothetical protein